MYGIPAGSNKVCHVVGLSLQIERHDAELDVIQEMASHAAGAANSWHPLPGEFCDSSGNKWDSRGSGSRAEDEAHASFESQPISNETAWRGTQPDASSLEPTLLIPNPADSAILAGACSRIRRISTFDWDIIWTCASLLAYHIRISFPWGQR